MEGLEDHRGLNANQQRAKKELAMQELARTVSGISGPEPEPIDECGLSVPIMEELAGSESQHSLYD